MEGCIRSAEFIDWPIGPKLVQMSSDFGQVWGLSIESSRPLPLQTAVGPESPRQPLRSFPVLKIAQEGNAREEGKARSLLTATTTDGIFSWEGNL